MRAFDEELTTLKQRMLRMGALVESQVANAIKALVDRNAELARAVIATDHEVNAYDVEIDEECIRLLALHHPTAGDLRFITTAMKISTDLERISDLAEDICERALELDEEPKLRPYLDIPLMADRARTMLREALDAFVNRDAELARAVCRSDDPVDELTGQIFREALSHMVGEPQTISRAIRITFIAKYLERIADHATNVAEMVVYMVEGKIIRHTTV
jgi:phosphate transport system protein